MKYARCWRAILLAAPFFIDQTVKYLWCNPRGIASGCVRNYDNAFFLFLPGNIALPATIFFLAAAVAWRRKPRLQLPLLLLAGSGASNAWDRLTQGAVLDPFGLGGFFFNVADIFIVAGALWLIVWWGPPLRASSFVEYNQHK